MSDQNECKCGDEGNEFHGCPFKKEIHGNESFQCNCCDECTEQCLMDI